MFLNTIFSPKHIFYLMIDYITNRFLWAILRHLTVSVKQLAGKDETLKYQEAMLLMCCVIYVGLRLFFAWNTRRTTR